MAQPHPIAVIHTAKTNFQFGSDKPIYLQTTPSNFVTIKTDIKNIIEQYDVLTTSAIKSQSLQENEKTTIEKFRNIGKRDILYSALAPDFIQKYQDEIRHETTYETLLSFIAEVIGSQSDKQKIAAAQRQMDSATRSVNENERWTRFYERIKRYANNISDKSEIREYLITNTFNRNVTPKLQTFLLEQGKTNLTTEGTAQFLDQMKKYKNDVVINQIEMGEATKQMAEVCKQNTQLQTQNQALHDKIDSLQSNMQQMIADAINQTKMEVNKIKATPKNTITGSDQPRNQPRYQPHYHPRNHYKRQTSNNEYPVHWELNKYGTPVRCSKCGVKGHSEQKCQGKVRCYNCQQMGHIQSRCPKQTPVSKN